METSLAVGLQRTALAYHFRADSFPDQAVAFATPGIEKIIQQK
jgi:hypothetical protein